MFTLTMEAGLIWLRPVTREENEIAGWHRAWDNINKPGLSALKQGSEFREDLVLSRGTFSTKLHLHSGIFNEIFL